MQFPLPSLALLVLGAVPALALPPDLAEANAASWSSWAQQGTIALGDDSRRAVSGAASVRINATGGFDNYLRYPADTLAKWDLRDVEAIRFRCFAVNPHSFQSQSPWVRLGHHRKGWFEWKPSSDVLNEAIGKWTEFVVPIQGDQVWGRSAHGTPDLGEIQYFELHADTWEYGFELWLDGVSFDRAR